MAVLKGRRQYTKLPEPIDLALDDEVLGRDVLQEMRGVGAFYNRALDWDILTEGLVDE